MIIKIRDIHKTIANPSHVFDMVSEYFKTIDSIDRDKEHFFVFHLNTRNKVKFMELVSIGTLNQSVVEPREVFTRAVAERSASIILAHNHPSDQANPSIEDISVTRRLQDAGKIISIEVLDHVICTSNDFYSMSRNGDM